MDVFCADTPPKISDALGHLEVSFQLLWQCSTRINRLSYEFELKPGFVSIEGY